MISSITSRSFASSATRGSASPECMSSLTGRDAARPMTPPGWRKRKSSGLNPRCSINATARQSPTTCVSVMLVVGVRSMGHASATGPSTIAAVLRWTSGEPGCATIEISAMPSRSR